MNQVKSDQYLLENILAHFTDDEVEKYKDRMILDTADVTVEKAEDLKVVLLDDWTISGSQLQGVASHITDILPAQFSSSLELQLIAANERRITRGLSRDEYASPAKLTIPVRAYYRAHHSEYGTYSDAHITGFHSSVDYDFENEINLIVEFMKKNQDSSLITQIMPPLTNIVRPYRQDGYELKQARRFRKETAFSPNRLQESSPFTHEKLNYYESGYDNGYDDNYGYGYGWEEE